MNLAPVTIIGNLTGDPELTFTTGGQARLGFGLASNHIWYDQAGEKQEKPSYFNVVAWRYLAENSARVLEKGVGVVVYGRLEQRSYEDKDGNKRSVVEVVAEEIAVATKSMESMERRARADASESGSASRPSAQAGQRRARPVTARVGAGAPDEPADEPF
jgi:single-strand DNA-binding protein